VRDEDRGRELRAPQRLRCSIRRRPGASSSGTRPHRSPSPCPRPVAAHQVHRVGASSRISAWPMRSSSDRSAFGVPGKGRGRLRIRRLVTGLWRPARARARCPRSRAGRGRCPLDGEARARPRALRRCPGSSSTTSPAVRERAGSRSRGDDGLDRAADLGAATRAGVAAGGTSIRNEVATSSAVVGRRDPSGSSSTPAEARIGGQLDRLDLALHARQEMQVWSPFGSMSTTRLPAQERVVEEQLQHIVLPEPAWPASQRRRRPLVRGRLVKSNSTRLPRTRQRVADVGTGIDPHGVGGERHHRPELLAQQVVRVVADLGALTGEVLRRTG